MADERENRPRLPPRWFVRLAWYTHRGIYRVTGGRVGLWRPRNNRWAPCDSPPLGVARGKERSVIPGYIEDGPNLVTLAMNGWADGEPVWWRNLELGRPCGAPIVGDRGRDPRATVHACPMTARCGRQSSRPSVTTTHSTIMVRSASTGLSYGRCGCRWDSTRP